MENSRNSNLHNAKDNKYDEFYTTYETIQSELSDYEKHFEGKTVLCNADDPFESNFCKFFLRNFNYLKLKRLICTSYTDSPVAGSQISLFDIINDTLEQGHGYVLDVTHVPVAKGRWVSDADMDKLLRARAKELKGDGDFRSHECVEYLKQADIVVTNPPFSLFREYVALLMKHNKKFLIIGSQNAITYKEIFPLLRENKVWLGTKSGDMSFRVPKDYEPRDIRYWEDETGQKWQRLGNVCWYTNLDRKKRHEEIILSKTYSPKEYPKYANYDAIEVSKVSNIPRDYNGVMGVPVTFLDKYNPDQFEIIGMTAHAATMDTPVQLGKAFINEYRRQGGTGHFSANMYGVYYFDNKGKIKVPYGRILIRRKQ